MCSLELGKKSYKKKEKRTHIWTLYFTHLPARPCRADFYHFLRVGFHRRRNHPCQILVRLIEGLGGYGAQNLGFPIDFDRRPYSSVTHYRATLWSACQDAVQLVVRLVVQLINNKSKYSGVWVVLNVRRRAVSVNSTQLVRSGGRQITRGRSDDVMLVVASRASLLLLLLLMRRGRRCYQPISGRTEPSQRGDWPPPPPTTPSLVRDKQLLMRVADCVRVETRWIWVPVVIDVVVWSHITSTAWSVLRLQTPTTMTTIRDQSSVTATIAQLSFQVIIISIIIIII